MTSAQLLRAAITKSGMSASGFATEVLTRDPRTIRRWLDGKTPIPPAVIDFLKRTHAEKGK